MTARTFQCPHCNRRLKSHEGAYTHIRRAHGHKAARAYAGQCNDPVVAAMHAKDMANVKRGAEGGRRACREPSMADLMVEAEINRAMGIRNEDWIEDMLP